MKNSTKTIHALAAKKIYCLLLLLGAMCFVGCKEKISIDHPIAGHTYYNYMDTDYGHRISFADFHANGDFTMSYTKHNIYQGDESSRYGNMLWSVDGNNITIKNDNSSLILTEQNGKVVYTGFYNPKDSTVTLNDIVYTFLK